MAKHSIRLERRRCRGCTNCIKKCPTEAIRVQGGKAIISEERCVDCGNCVSACPYKAMVTSTDSMDELKRFRYNIAIPSPALYAQFQGIWDVGDVLKALIALGFDYVYEEAKAAEIVSEATKEYIRGGEAILPIISTNCPVVLRLIQLRFHELTDNLVPLESPMEVAAKVSKREFCLMTGVPYNEVGAFYISPCAAKATAVRNPMGNPTSEVDGVIPITDVYVQLSKLLKQDMELPYIPRAGAFGVGWAMSGGESTALGTNRYLAVDGIDNVIRCLEEIEDNRFQDLLFFEGTCCTCGCVGGTLTFENAFVAKNKIRRLANSLPRIEFGQDEHIKKYVQSDCIALTQKIEPQYTEKLDSDMAKAAQKMEEMELISRGLPGLDCGSCGSPTCRTLAEDIVKGNAVELDCIFKMRDRIRALADEMIVLADAHKRG